MDYSVQKSKMALVLVDEAVDLEKEDEEQREKRKESFRKLRGQKKYVGLSNQGATCYMNSLLQSLFMTPEFRRAIYQWKFSPEGDINEEECIPLQLQRLFCLLQSSSSKSVETTALTKSFGWTDSDSFQQHDVQELCRVLFDALEASFKGTVNETLVNDLYQGILNDYVMCCECGFESSRKDHFLDLSLVIRPFGTSVTNRMKSVEEALEFFLKPEVLNGDNQWFCSKCETKRDAIKGLKLEKLPYVLALQLKRFDFDYTTFNRIKLNDKVTFPKVLNVQEYMEGDVARRMSLERRDLETNHESTADAAAAVEEMLPQEQEPMTWIDGMVDDGMYELFSVLIHSGSALGGHYYAYIKSLDDDTWYNFNDSTVSPIQEKDVMTAFGGGKNHCANAYMLMYRLKSHELNQTTPETVDLPLELQQVVAQEAEKQAKLEEERKKRLNRLVLRVTYRDEELNITVDKTSTLHHVTTVAYEAFSHTDTTVENVRLRSYSQYNRILLETYGPDKINQSLSDLHFYNNKSLYLESKQPGQEWTEYDPTALQLHLIEYLRPSNSFAPSKMVQIRPDATIAELCDDYVVWKFTATGSNAVRADELRPTDTLRSDCHLVSGTTLYIESVSDPNPGGALELYEYNLNRIELKFSLRDEPEAGEKSIWIDKREKVTTLREKVGGILKLDVSEFRLLKGGIGTLVEIKHDDEMTIKEALLFHHSIFYVEKGAPLLPGQFHFKFALLMEEKMSDGMNQQLTSLDSTRKEKDYKPICSLVVESTTLISKLRQEIQSKLDDAGQAIRLRERIGLRPSRVLNDGETLQEASSQNIYEGRTIVVEILAQPETLCRNLCLLTVSWFERQTFRFSKPIECVIEANSIVPCAIHEDKIHTISLFETLSRLREIPIEHLLIARPAPYRSLHVTAVNELKWYSPSTFDEKITPITSGDLWLASDGRIPLKELSDQEKAELKPTQRTVTYGSSSTVAKEAALTIRKR